MAKSFTTEVRSVGKNHNTTFTIGTQTFTVYHGTSKKIARWYEQMLIFALETLIDDTKNRKSRHEREKSGKDA